MLIDLQEICILDVIIKRTKPGRNGRCINRHLKACGRRIIKVDGQGSISPVELAVLSRNTRMVPAESHFGVTVPATLKVELIHNGEHPVAKFIDYYKGEWLGFHASAEIDTAPFGFALPVGVLAFDISTEMKAE